MEMDKRRWLSIALIDLSVVAILGVVLRSKILFSIPFIDFKDMLQAHSHFAFGGWVSLALLTLMTFDILPEQCRNKAVYKWSLSAIFFSSVGMLATFPFTGYAFLSILFSVSFIFTTYVFGWAFIADLRKSASSRSTKLLAITSLTSLVLSSAGPFTLAYVMASHSANTMLYRDSIYTYLHLQYNGFFTAGVFALFSNAVGRQVSEIGERNMWRFAVAMAVCILPTLFLSYLWHYESAVVRTVAIVGCCCLAVVLVLFFIMMGSVKGFTGTLNVFTKRVGVLAMTGFVLKTAVQAGIVIPSVGNAVFGDRPIIIGYLHLVFLGFVTLYLFAHIFQSGFFIKKASLAKTGIVVFVCGVIINEAVLMTQGLSAMAMLSSTLYPSLLLIVAIWLAIGAIIVAAAVAKNIKVIN